jgi:hypothetical protein
MQLPRHQGSALWHGHGTDPPQCAGTPRPLVAVECSSGSSAELLGAAGEALGFDKHLKASTTKRRVHSLFRRGCLHYQLMPTMQEARLRLLMEKFAQLILEQPLLANIYGADLK